ncbi:MAG TPA: carbon-nitrogen family hydrolase [Thiomicrospira sp.]|nr:carbon-nitrogen family hydrolase [Thiomicrospira sp.]
MRIASIQLDSVWQDAEANLTALASYRKQLKKDLVDVVVLPELFHSGFSMNTKQIQQDRTGLVYSKLSQLAKELGIYIIAGVALKSDGNKALNSALVFDRNGTEQACYIKNYAFSYANEDQFYQAGTQQVIFNIDDAACSVFICYDLRFPEVFRKVAQQVEMVFVIANWPASRQQHWQTLLQARAIENQCFVVGVNRTGEDGNGLLYEGGSSVISPFGEILSGMDADSHYLVTEVDPKQALTIRERFPFLNDMQ